MHLPALLGHHCIDLPVGRQDVLAVLSVEFHMPIHQGACVYVLQVTVFSWVFGADQVQSRLVKEHARKFAANACVDSLISQGCCIV